jgi:hypothetical protein
MNEPDGVLKCEVCQNPLFKFGESTFCSFAACELYLADRKPIFVDSEPTGELHYPQ